MSINSVVLMGRLTADPDYKHTQSGISVVSFTVAVDRNYKSGEEKQADFINCTAWRGTADFISRYFTKGSPIALTGRIQTRKWQTDDGQNRYATEVVCDNVSFVPKTKSDNAQNGAGGSFNTFAGSGYGTAQIVNSGSFAETASNSNEFAELKEDVGELPF